MSEMTERYSSMSSVAREKLVTWSVSPLEFIVAAILAGVYIGFGVLLSFSVGGMMQGIPWAKLIMGATFGIALSLVVICKAELFTGNNMVLMAGRMQKTISTSEMIGLWILCWAGNFVGGLALAGIFEATGLETGATAQAMATAAIAKVTATPVELFWRGVLCNTLVCLAVWAGYMTKSDTAKLVMVFWCLLAFFTTGFEHSVANMTLLNLAVMDGAITIWQMFYNLLFVTAGNVVGGVLLAIFYRITSGISEMEW